MRRNMPSFTSIDWNHISRSFQAPLGPSQEDRDLMDHVEYSRELARSMVEITERQLTQPPLTTCEVCLSILMPRYSSLPTRYIPNYTMPPQGLPDELVVELPREINTQTIRDPRLDWDAHVNGTDFLYDTYHAVHLRGTVYLLVEPAMHPTTCYNSKEIRVSLPKRNPSVMDQATIKKLMMR